ncbi:carbon monoxide dehydrogenase [Nocardioides guangzhouensis]|uniref:Carbon monoxide dehydrogenase n=1 Tax=Nocardioides guangzhouensis TaxID=2497878 RepID=A0A4Q4Z8S8_9ACTN|nr:SRPBCC family protein [Nocardioides guangzhouensis]RYP83536.1 carbon monoxide dehydrogenase [Nocardioides guangzhouensis]
MDLTHSFTVPLSVDESWEHFNDIASVAECFPGAQVTSVDGDTFQGSCKVKLGPIALVYNGSGTFVEKDAAAHRFVVDAKGKDKRGNGTAGAHVTLAMTEVDEGTSIEVTTELAITGKPAQFGRGVMQDVSDKLLGQFVACLEQRFTEQPEEAEAPEAAAAAPEAAAEAPASAGGVAASNGTAAAAPAAGASGGGASAAAARRAPGPAPASGEDALDLGATVLPVVLKSYWRQIVAGLVVLLVLRKVRKRRKRKKAATAVTPTTD